MDCAKRAEDHSSPTDVPPGLFVGQTLGGDYRMS